MVSVIPVLMILNNSLCQKCGIVVDFKLVVRRLVSWCPIWYRGVLVFNREINLSKLCSVGRSERLSRIMIYQIQISDMVWMFFVWNGNTKYVNM
jgi:hypothetical protein